MRKKLMNKFFNVQERRTLLNTESNIFQSGSLLPFMTSLSMFCNAASFKISFSSDFFIFWWCFHYIKWSWHHFFFFHFMALFYYMTREVGTSFNINKIFFVFFDSYFKVPIFSSYIQFLTADARQFIYPIRILKNIMFLHRWEDFS